MPAHPRSRGENRPRPERSHDHAGSSPLTRGKPARTAAAPGCKRLIPAHAGKTLNRSSGELHVWAHPRSRGENFTAIGVPYGPIGSSPLTRGKPGTLRAFLISIRLIPAHAGKTLTARRGQAASPAHPRSRGENVSAVAALAMASGSSPLTRGKLRAQSG